jgi:hypothetical protein
VFCGSHVLTGCLKVWEDESARWACSELWGCSSPLAGSRFENPRQPLQLVSLLMLHKRRVLKEKSKDSLHSILFQLNLSPEVPIL